MKFKSLLLYTLFLGVLFSCSEDDPCSDTGDIARNASFTFALVDQDLNNLCDTNNATYHLDSIYVVWQGSSDTVYIENSLDPDTITHQNPDFSYIIAADGRPYFTMHHHFSTNNSSQYFVHLNSNDVDTITVLTEKPCARAQHPRFECLSFCMKYNNRIFTSCDNCSTSRSDLFRKILIYK